jgi:hypothetical protein
VSDITYLCQHAGGMALPGGDFGSVQSEVVGWKLGETLQAELVALKNALEAV